MTPLLWVTGALSLAGAFLAAFLYLRGEPSRVSSRHALLCLRVGSFAVVTLLLFDPLVPGEDPDGAPPDGGRWLVVDPDLSLTVPGPGGAALWDELVRGAALAETSGARLALALPGDGGIEGVDGELLAMRAPRAPRAELGMSVARLAEAGADSIVILSTFRRRPAEIQLLIDEASVPVRLERVGERTRNTGIGEFALPAAVPEGDGVTARVGLFGEGGLPGDSVAIEFRAEGELVRNVRVPMPTEGEEANLVFELPPPPGPGLVRYTVEVELEGDLFLPDDRRSHWLTSGGESRGIVLVSLAPDWEPRVLLPILEAVTGLASEGFLRLGDGRFLPVVAGSEPSSPVDDEAVRDRLAAAEILVVQGGLEDPPPWLADAVAGHARVIHLPGAGAGAALTGLSTGAVLPGEWAPRAELPPSPLSPFLVGISLVGLPPLSTVLPLSEPMPVVVALDAQAPGGEESAPALVLVEDEGGRRAVALAEGFWRWGVRDGEARRAYRGLWGGVASWLLARPPGGTREVARPETVIQSRGERLRWEVSERAENLELTLTPGEGGVGGGPAEAGLPRYRGPLRADGAVATTPPVEPGVYRFDVRELGVDSPDSILSSGLVEVDRWAPSLRLLPLEFGDGGIGAPSEGADALPAGRPLRTHPLPYLLLLLLLSAEWIGRRRVGLR